MNECFTDPIFGNFSVERKRKVKEGVRKRKEERLRESEGGGEKEEGGEVEGKVSYSVSGDLQIT